MGSIVRKFLHLESCRYEVMTEADSLASTAPVVGIITMDKEVIKTIYEHIQSGAAPTRPSSAVPVRLLLPSHLLIPAHIPLSRVLKYSNMVIQ